MDDLIQGLRAGQAAAFERLVREFGDRIYRFVRRLAGECWAEDLIQEVFLLREEGGLSFKEIAEMTGCPLNTALGRMHYAMEALRKSLKAYGMQ